MASARPTVQGPLARLRGWWLRRLPATAEQVLTHRNLYVLPTRAGWMLGLTLLLLLVGSINYQLNLGYLLTFLLAGSVAVGVHVGHVNLRGLRLRAGPGGEIFASQPAPIKVTVSAEGRRTRRAVALQWLAMESDPVCVDIPAGDSTVAMLPATFPHRGRHRLPPLRIETRYPMGAFQLWSWWRPAADVLVYPCPESPCPPLPSAEGSDDEDRPHQAQPRPAAVDADELPDAVRAYRAGDAPNRVLWKKAARGDGEPTSWVVREAPPATGRAELWLDEAATGLAETEARRARLCAWVLKADAHGLRYGLRLGGLTMAPDNGPIHRTRCLEVLACH